MRLVVGTFPENYRGFLFKLYKQAGVDASKLRFVRPEMGLVDPTNDRIDAFGEDALRYLTERKGIDNWRGSALSLVISEPSDLRVMPTYAPDWLMANQWAIPTVISDLKKSLAQPPEFYNLEPEPKDLEEYVGQSIAFDIETAWPVSDDITMVGISSRPFHVVVVPFSEPYLPVLKRIFANAPNLISQNGLQFDGPRLAEAGVAFHPEVEEWDIMLMEHLLEPDSPHDLGFITSKYTNKPYHKDQKGINEALYCARDVDATLQAFHQLKPLLIQHKLLDLYRYTQVPLAKICHLMTKTGIRQDPTRVAVVREKTIAAIADTENLLPKELHSYALTHSPKTGKPLKRPKLITPWAQKLPVETWLHKTLSLPVQYKTKKNKQGITVRTATLDKKALTKLYLTSNNKAVDALRRIREYRQLISNFLSAKNTKVEIMHPRFNPHGTNEGRLSSAGPSFQNQPAEARVVYMPLHPQRVLVEPDYSSGENRLVAWFSRDKARLERMNQPGFSEHKYHAQVVFGVPHDEVGKKDEIYRLAKVINHGRGYGMGAKKIAQDNDLDFKFVKDALAKIDADKPLMVRWQKIVPKKAEEEGELTNPFGRKRFFWSDRIYTTSLAFLPASTLADVCFRAMISLMYQRIGWPEWKARKVCSVLAPLPEGADLHLQVHDSLLFSVEPEIMHNALEAIKTAMEMRHEELDGFYLPIEMKVGKPGQSWGELE